ncbi:helix-turn-helix domain-containing protein [Paenibacillus thiaminolyticus]|uniref:helix-turn-helix domain-containing protein n=1 Tax=Paenibacillus thiaminolyticus TaxID=49283 RepID=UPI0035A6EB9D
MSKTIWSESEWTNTARTGTFYTKSRSSGRRLWPSSPAYSRSNGLRRDRLSDELDTPHFQEERLLQFAHSLLCVTALPVTEICYASGFSTLNHFERSFKKKYGGAPRSLQMERNARPDHMPTISPGG